jgi:hypothetical protein
MKRQQPAHRDMFLRHEPQHAIALEPLARPADEFRDDPKVVGLAAVHGRIRDDPVVTHRLVNKLMSRNYGEYDLIKNGPAPLQENIGVREYEEALEEKEILRELNGLIT